MLPSPKSPQPVTTPISASATCRAPASPRNWRIATEGPEYEPAWALGADTGVSDLDAVLKANYLCNELGMDPISLGSTIASAMEMYERGVVTEAETGMALRFGSGEALVAIDRASQLEEARRIKAETGAAAIVVRAK